MVKLIRILHFEDNQFDGELIARELKKFPIPLELMFVQDAKDYLSALERQRFDIILSDYRMPGYDGDQALRAAKHLCPDTPFIMVTGELGEERAIETLKRGATDYVLKDKLQRLLPAIQRALDEACMTRQRREAEEAFRQSEQRYRLLFETMESGFASHEIICDEAGKPVDYRFLEANKHFEALTGLNIPDILGKTVREVIPGIEQSWIDRYGEVALTGKAMRFESYSRSLRTHYQVVAYCPAPRQFATIFTDVTEQKETENTLRRAKKELEDRVVQRTEELRTKRQSFEEQSVILDAFFRHTVTPLVFLDQKFNFIRVNEAYARACQKSVSDFPGHNHFEFYPHEGNQRIFEQVVRSRTPFTARAKPFIVSDHPEVENTYWDWTLVPLLNKIGDVEFLVFSLEDVTEREQAVRELKQHHQELESILEERTGELRLIHEKLFVDASQRKEGSETVRTLTKILEQSPTSIVITDPTGAIEYVNPKFCAVTGYTREEVHGKNPRILKSGRSSPDEYRDLWETIKAGREWRGEFCNKKKSGEIYWELASISPVRDDQGHIIHFVSVKEDITARKHMEEELRSIARFPGENPNPVLRIGQKGTLLFANDAAKPLLDTLHWVRAKRVSDEWLDQIGLAMDLNTNITREVSCGQRLFALMLVPLPNTGYINIYGRDITDQRKAELHLHKLNEELEQRVLERTRQMEHANKDLEAFSYSVSHDLRAPLRAISAYAGILREDETDRVSDEGKRNLDLISAKITEMGDLIEHILRFSRLGTQALQKELIPTREMIEKVIQEEPVSVAQDRTLQFVFGELPDIWADPVTIRQVWTNLISNAVKFTQHVPDARIEIGSLRNQPGAVTFFVKDNGAGFDMEYANKLFGIFQRLHSEEEFKGTGVGLAFCKRIIERHGGRIWAEGEIDKGAIVYFTLPER